LNIFYCFPVSPKFDLPTLDTTNLQKKPIFICDYCGEKGHKVTSCFKLNPEHRHAYQAKVFRLWILAFLFKFIDLLNIKQTINRWEIRSCNMTWITHTKVTNETKTILNEAIRQWTRTKRTYAFLIITNRISIRTEAITTNPCLINSITINTSRIKAIVCHYHRPKSLVSNVTRKDIMRTSATKVFLLFSEPKTTNSSFSFFFLLIFWS